MQLFASVRTFRRGGQKAVKADKLSQMKRNPKKTNPPSAENNVIGKHVAETG
jgi:hypothetical protein